MGAARQRGKMQEISNAREFRVGMSTPRARSAWNLLLAYPKQVGYRKLIRGKRRRGKERESEFFTPAIWEELDEPGVEADAIRGSETDILILEMETGRGDWVCFGEARDDGHVDQLLLKCHQQRHPRDHDPSYPIQQGVYVIHHFPPLPSPPHPATLQVVPAVPVSPSLPPSLYFTFLPFFAAVGIKYRGQAEGHGNRWISWGKERLAQTKGAHRATSFASMGSWRQGERKSPAGDASYLAWTQAGSLSTPFSELLFNGVIRKEFLITAPKNSNHNKKHAFRMSLWSQVHKMKLL